MTKNAPTVLGLDFGTTNSVAAVGDSRGNLQLIRFGEDDSSTSLFRSAMCFWLDTKEGRDCVDGAAGPWAIREYLASPLDSRFIQSFKSVAASAIFSKTQIYNKSFEYEDLMEFFLRELIERSEGRLASLPDEIVVGRPIRFAGANPDENLALERYGRVFSRLTNSRIHYVYEPLAAAFSAAESVTDEEVFVIGDFGGGTTDFSIVRIISSPEGKRCIPLGNAGIGIAGDRFDFRILDHLVLPLLGKGGQYESFGKTLEIPRSYFADFSDWSRLALMKNYRTLVELRRLKNQASEPEKIERLLQFIQAELGYALYQAVGRVKQDLSSSEEAIFRFSGNEIDIEQRVRRADFDRWIEPDLARMGQTLDQAMREARLRIDEIDRVFLTGGTSLVPAVREMMTMRFGAEKITSGAELTSVAHGLGLIGLQRGS